MPSQLLDAPVRSRRELRLGRSVQGADLFTPATGLSVLDAAQAPLLRQVTTSSVSQSFPEPLHTQGVVDSRPQGVHVLDLRSDDAPKAWFELPAQHEGLVDNRPMAPEELTGPIAMRPRANRGVFDAYEAAPAATSVPDWDTTEFAVPGRNPIPGLNTEASIETVSSSAAGEHVTVPAPPIPTSSPYMRRSEMRRLEAKSSRRSPLRRNGTSIGIPQVGIVSALGLATIAAPLTGSFSAPAKAGVNALSQSASVESLSLAAPRAAVAAAQFPQTTARVNAVEEARLVVDDVKLSVVPSTLAAPSHVLARTAKSGSTAVLPGCDGVVPASAKSASNGKLPASALCTLWNRDEGIRADAAIDLAIMNVAYRKEFGKDLCVLDGYRTLSEQYRVKQLRGGFAAAPGTSEHGWGLAIDICGGGGLAGTPTYKWLRANAATYGWQNPDWALSSGSGPYEPWHWEYFRGQDHVSGQD